MSHLEPAISFIILVTEHNSLPLFVREKNNVCFTHGSVLGSERERLTVHLWAASKGATYERRRKGRGCSQNHFSSHLSGSLWALTLTDPHLQIEIPPVPPPPAAPSARHTPRGIQNALTPNQWETVKKAEKRIERG